MRIGMRWALSAVIACGLATSALAIEPDDTPWDEIDRVLKDPPKGAGDARPANDENSPGPTGGAPSAATPAQAPQPAQAPPPVEAARPAEPSNPSTGQATQTAPPSSPPAGQTAQPATPPTNTAPATAAPDQSAAPAIPAAAATAPPYVPTFPLPIKSFFEQRAAVLLRGADATDIAALSQFYDARLGDALWVTKDGFNDGGKDLIAELGRATDWGLKASDYVASTLPPAPLTPDALAEADVRLSLAAMTYARHARGDRIIDPTTQLSSYLDRKPQLVDRAKLLAELASAASKSSYITSLHPKHPQFAALRKKLLEMRAATPEPIAVIPKGPKLSPGKSHPHVALIRKRLNVASPGMKPDGTAATDDFYDQTLAAAVIRFKEKNAIEPANPAIDAKLRAAFNGSGPVTEETILANMEEWRWMPEDLGATHIAVNIPEFLVRVIKDGHAIHTERVVTGQVSTQTPIFSDEMRTVVFRPPWIVPDSIKVNELLPRLRSGSDPIAGRGLVMSRNGREISPWSVDWYTGDIRTFDIQQPPGPSNVLGVVKFLFPNKHAVYLHDTPSKSLFDAKQRTFSHGCVRVRNPVRLAEVLMAEDKGWDAAKIKELVETGPDNNETPVDKPIPVHITYFTAWVDEAGELKTFADVYGHESRIKLALAGRWSEIDVGRDHLAPVEVPVAAGYDDWYSDDPYGGFGYYDQRGRRYARNGYRYILPPQKKKPSLGGFLNDLFGN